MRLVPTIDPRVSRHAAVIHAIRHTFAVLLVALPAVATAAPDRSAPTPSTPSAPPSPPAALSIDASTVRVFSIGTVAADIVEYRGRQIQVADAVAGHGTGFIVGDRLVMTAHHVIDGARHVVVRLPGRGGFYPARVVFAEKDNDVAVLALETEGQPLPPPLALADTTPRVRSNVFAIGYPIDAARTQPQSARGIVAGFLDDGTIQLDIALNPGNSGGPIVDEHDAVLGMAIARGNVDKGVQGIGYAVPIARLRFALGEGQRRLQDDAASTATPTSRDSAMVVDELVQNGALDELRKAADLNAGVRVSDVDQALASIIDRIKDPDLLVFVAGALWNVSLIIELGDPSETKLTPAQANVLGNRLRASSSIACRRAVELDAGVSSRSSFVRVVLGASPAEVSAYAHGSAPQHSGPRPAVMMRASPLMRMNPDAGTVGLGLSASIGLMSPRSSRVFRIFSVSFGGIEVEGDSGEFRHLLLSAEIGIGVRAGKLELDAALAPGWYSSTVLSTDAMESASAFVMSYRFGAALRFGTVQVGAAARVLTGPTLWLEPAYLSVQF
ncbi:MAG: S1C family serine protease [Kofleriaceae bacterium]